MAFTSVAGWPAEQSGLPSLPEVTAPRYPAGLILLKLPIADARPASRFLLPPLLPRRERWACWSPITWLGKDWTG